MLISSKLVVGTCNQPPPPVPPPVPPVMRVVWVVVVVVWCAAIFSNIPTIHLSKHRAKCYGCLYSILWGHRYATGICCAVLCTHNYHLSGSFTVGSPLFKLKLTFYILLNSAGDNLQGVLIISQDSWLSLGNY